MADKKNPAEIAAEAFGGPHALSRALGLSPSTISCWIHRSGAIPRKHIQPVLAAAKKNGIKLKLDQLI